MQEASNAYTNLRLLSVEDLTVKDLLLLPGEEDQVVPSKRHRAQGAFTKYKVIDLTGSDPAAEDDTVSHKHEHRDRGIFPSLKTKAGPSPEEDSPPSKRIRRGDDLAPAATTNAELESEAEEPYNPNLRKNRGTGRGYPPSCRAMLFDNPAFLKTCVGHFYVFVTLYVPTAVPLDSIAGVQEKSYKDLWQTHNDGTVPCLGGGGGSSIV
jgi:hypothetical protein